MPVEITITESDPRFFDALRDPEGFMPILGDAMKNIVRAFEEKASVPAPESEANQPGRVSLKTHEPMGYYERGRGWWYPLLTHNTLGLAKEIPLLKPHLKAPHTLGSTALKAVGIMGVAGYRLSPTSEQMEDRWATDVQQQANEVLGILSNTASYSGLVQGLEQVKLHKARGWIDVMTNWNSGEIQNVVDDETIKAIDTYYNL